MEDLYSTLRTTRVSRIGPLQVSSTPRDHGVYFNTQRKTVSYTPATGRFGPWHDTTDNTFLGIPILQMQHINIERIRKALEKHKVVPVMLQSSTETPVNLDFYFVDGTRAKRKAYMPQMDSKIAKYLSKLLRHVNARTFDPYMFLQDVVQRILPHNGAPKNKTWFGMPLHQQQVMSANTLLQGFVSKILRLNMASKHGIMIHNNMVCIYNTTLCPQNHIIMVPSRYITRHMETVKPSDIRNLLKRHCRHIMMEIENRFPNTMVRFASIKGDTVRLYTSREGKATMVPAQSVLWMLLSRTPLDNIDNFLPKPKPNYTYAALSTFSIDTLEGIAEREGVDTALVSSFTYGKKPLMVLLVSQYKQCSRTIRSWDDIIKHAPRAFFVDAAADVGYATTKFQLDNKRIILVMLQGLSERNAIHQVKSGIRGSNTYVHYNYNANKTTRLKLQNVKTMASRLGNKVNMHTVAGRIVINKDIPKITGFNYKRNIFTTNNGTVIPGENFANAYRHFNASATNFTNTNVINKALARHNSQKKFIGYRRLEQKRVAVEEQLFSKYTNKDSMSFAKAVLLEAYEIGGSLANRPLFVGNVGKATDKNKGKSPLEQYKRAQNSSQPVIEDGCNPQIWPNDNGHSISMHQSIAFATCRLKSMGYLGNLPGLFCYYSVGAGKTVTVLSIIIAFWNDTKVIIPASARSNSKEGSNDLPKFAQEACLYFPWFRSNYVGIIEITNGTSVQKFTMEEYPFAHGPKIAEQQLKNRLRMGHAMAGHKKATSLPEGNLLNTYTTAWNLISGQNKGHDGYLSGRSKVMKNCVFILDEIQLLFNPPSTEEKHKNEYKEFKKVVIGRDKKSSFAVALTATPGDTKGEVHQLYTLVMGQKEVTSIPKDVTSSVYVSGDLRYFPKVEVKRHCIFLPHSYDSNNNSNRTTRSRSKKKESNIDSLAHPALLYTQCYFLTLAKRTYTHDGAENAMKRLRIGTAPNAVKVAVNHSNAKAISEKGKMRALFYRHTKDATEFVTLTDRNLSNAQKKMGMDFGNDGDPSNSSILMQEDVMDKIQNFATNPNFGVVLTRTKTWPKTVRLTDRQKTKKQTQSNQDNTTNNTRVTRSILLVSPKIIRMIRTLVTKEGVHYVYCENYTTMRLCAHILHTVYGWSMYKRNSQHDPTSKRFGFLAKLSAGKTRFMDTRKLNRSAKNIPDSAFIPTAESSPEDAVSLLRCIESNANKDGGLCRVIFATQDSFKGVNTKNISHVHMVSAMSKWTDLIQLVGRGTRFRSHCALDKAFRKVTVHVWSLEPPEGLNINKYPYLFPDRYLQEYALEIFKEGIGGINDDIIKKSFDSALLGDTFQAFKDLNKKLSSTCDVRPTRRLTNYEFANRRS